MLFRSTIMIKWELEVILQLLQVMERSNSSISGRKEVYERRTIRSNCRNGLRYVRKISVENCECARSDYICDFGFRKDAAWTESCVKNPDFGHDPYAVPSDCKPGRFYNRTRGYVKIRGDTCVDRWT